VPRTDPSLGDLVEDYWLTCHDLWMQPIGWLTAWWDTFMVPISGHRILHVPDHVPGQPLVVPTAIARGDAPTLFA